MSNGRHSHNFGSQQMNNGGYYIDYEQPNIHTENGHNLPYRAANGSTGRMLSGSTVMGAVIGGAVGGPVGLVVGAMLGGFFSE